MNKTEIKLMMIKKLIVLFVVTATINEPYAQTKI